MMHTVSKVDNHTCNWKHIKIQKYECWFLFLPKAIHMSNSIQYIKDKFIIKVILINKQIIGISGKHGTLNKKTFQLFFVQIILLITVKYKSAFGTSRANNAKIQNVQQRTKITNAATPQGLRYSSNFKIMPIKKKIKHINKVDAT